MSIWRFSQLSAGVLSVWLSCLTGATRAGDWPQILGPQRNGQATGEKLTVWPKQGPRVVWTHEVGAGYAGPAVAAGRVLIFHRLAEKERLEALDAGSGRVLWQRDFPATYRGGVDPDTGPRCVPVIHEGQVYVFGAAGELHSVTLATGQSRWSRKLYAEFRGNEGYFGAGSSPIAVGDKLLVNVGGDEQAGIVALALGDGQVRWKATDEKASYASPTLASVQGQTIVVFATRMNVVGLDPVDGAVKFRLPFGRRGPTVNAATPLMCGQQLFLTANYGVGAKLLRIDGPQAAIVWENDESLSSQYASPVYVAGYLYGIHGREDVGVPDLRCVEAATGKVAWSAARFGTGHLIAAEGRLLILATDGRLVLAEASPKAFQVLAEAKISPEVTRALPALADGKLYVRDNARDRGLLRCLELRN